MKKSFLLLAILYGTCLNSAAQNLFYCNDANIEISLIDGNCQGIATPFDLLTGDITTLLNNPGSYQINVVNDLDPSNGAIVDGIGQFIYEVACLDPDLCGDFLGCWNYINTIPDIVSNAALICPAANPGGNAPGGTQDCEKVCAGSTVTYSLQEDSLSTIDAVQVSGSDNFTLFDNRVEVTWEDAGFGSLSLLITGPCETAQQVFTCTEILENPTAGFKTLPEASGDTLFICQGQSVQFLNNSQAAESFFWSFGDGNTSAEGQPSHRYVHGLAFCL